MKFVDDDDDDEQRHIFTSLLNIWCWQSLLKVTNTVLLLLVILCKTTSDVTQNYTMQIRQFSPFHSTVFTSIMFWVLAELQPSTLGLLHTPCIKILDFFILSYSFYCHEDNLHKNTKSKRKDDKVFLFINGK